MFIVCFMHVIVDTEHRIIGGWPVDITDRPFQVLITRKTSFGTVLLCGGALLNSRWVLTAAQLLYIFITLFITNYSQIISFVLFITF